MKRTKETDVQRRRRTGKIISRLRKVHPEAATALDFRTPLELLIATILSAQCTDERVNIVTKKLFAEYRSAEEYAGTDSRKLEGIIRSTGFYRAKARNIIGCCRGLVERFEGNVPDRMEDLVALPGVGRKTANVVLGNAFGKAEGIVVDTHVRRIANRLGLTGHDDPEKIETDLMELVPRKDWIEFPHLLIWHGRKICKARSPLCATCPVAADCPSAGSAG
ncbi:MAG TPA: endonuclease III [Bacteroidota bacterium]|nr:endonuclease III [Bacteroidota bacterium]